MNPNHFSGNKKESLKNIHYKKNAVDARPVRAGNAQKKLKKIRKQHHHTLWRGNIGCSRLSHHVLCTWLSLYHLPTRHRQHEPHTRSGWFLRMTFHHAVHYRCSIHASLKRTNSFKRTHSKFSKETRNVNDRRVFFTLNYLLV